MPARDLRRGVREAAEGDVGEVCPGQPRQVEEGHGGAGVGGGEGNAAPPSCRDEILQAAHIGQGWPDGDGDAEFRGAGEEVEALPGLVGQVHGERRDEHGGGGDHAEGVAVRPRLGDAPRPERAARARRVAHDDGHAERLLHVRSEGARDQVGGGARPEAGDQRDFPAWPSPLGLRGGAPVFRRGEGEAAEAGSECPAVHPLSSLFPAPATARSSAAGAFPRRRAGLP